jgi:cytochrome c553
MISNCWDRASRIRRLKRRRTRLKSRAATGGGFLLVLFLFSPVAQRALYAQSAAAAKHIDFNRDIRPILSDTCFKCHGPDEETRQANLRFDTKDGGAFEPREGYRIIVPGASAESRLFQKISSKDEAFRMPPVDSGRSLTAKQIELIRQWIDQGAKWETHWAYLAPKRPPLPRVQNARWPRNSIDNFILARLESEKLRPSPETGRATLLRRVSLDLTGLPPTPKEIAAFLADRAPDAYEKRVDALLASPHYGERLAMQWLDLARYADTHGYHIDSHREMWHWRDWVIETFNRNLPFDQFIVDQLAGDLLPSPTVEQRIATGFCRNHMINFEGGAIPAEYHNEYVVDRVDTVANVFMGSTLGCSRCHDHKYDPFKLRDYYRLYALFNNVPEQGLDGREGNAEPVLELPSPEQQQQLDELKEKIAAAKAALPEKEITALQGEWQKTALTTIPSDPRDGLVSLYEFDSDLADSSGHGANGQTLQGGVAYDFGRVGRAAEFSGFAHIQLGTAAAFDPSHAFALAVWFSPGSKFEMSVLQQLADARSRRGFEILLDSRRGFEILLDEAHWIGAQKRASHIIVCLTHEWPDDALEVRTRNVLPLETRHLTINYDGSGRAAGLQMFVDGKAQELEITRDHLTGSPATTSPLEIGNPDLGKAFSGSLDDLRVYNRPLTAEEIEQLAIQQPIRAMLRGLSGACAKVPPAELDGDTSKNEDPLIEESMFDTPEFRVKSQCLGEKKRLREYFLTYVAPKTFRQAETDLEELTKRKAELEKLIPNTMVMQEMSKPRETHILGRGDYRNQGEVVTAGVPAVLPPLPKGAPLNRLGLAQWLVDPSHPLTARVAVNRYWQLCFGTGLVKTSEDFGSQGEPPSHPELLDWLASEFVRTHWDVKAMMRLIVTSATYRQSSRDTPALIERDPENRLLARGPRSRLPAEIVRDNSLAVSGLLNPSVGGPSVFPYQPAGLWEEMAFGEGFTAQEYTPSHGSDLYRRSMYNFWKHTVPPPSLSTFDAPDREKCVARRAVTNTPLQALVLLNDTTYVEAARALAQRVIADAGPVASQRIRLAFRLATGRAPTLRETQILAGLERTEMLHYRQDRDAATKLVAVGESPTSSKADPSELAAWTTVANAILNLDETITKE